MEHQNSNKKAVFFIILGAVLAAFGIVLRKKPDTVEAFKTKIAKRFGGNWK